MVEQILNFISFFIIFKADKNLSEGKKKKAMLLIILFVVFFGSISKTVDMTPCGTEI